MLKVDFENAFNSHRRDLMLREVQKHVPALLPMTVQAYRRPTPIYFGNKAIQSRCGCQQGDVSSPLLFSLVLQDILKNMKSSLALGYLDDVTLCDADPSVVLADLLALHGDHVRSGLKIKPAKCELYLQGYSAEECAQLQQRFRNVLPGCRLILQESDLVLLGSALVPDAVPTVLASKITEYKQIFKRLDHVSAHAATYIMQHAAGVQKLVHAMRPGPAFLAADTCSAVDDEIIQCMEKIFKTSLSAQAVSQMSLPCAMGGLGIALPSRLALPAFLASSNAAKPFLQDILRDSEVIPAMYDAAQRHWSTTYDESPEEDSNHVQKSWSKITHQNQLNSLKDAFAASPVDTIRLEHVCQPEAGLWLRAFPSQNIGTLLSYREFVIAASLRLGLPALTAHQCICGAAVEPNAHHKLSCALSNSGRESRHSAVNDLLSRALRQAGISNTREPRNLIPNSDIRPDGVTLQPWSRGRYLAWDVTIRDTFAPSYRAMARTPGGVAKKAEEEKSAKYAALSAEYSFMPIVIESSGFWGKSALELTKRIGRRITSQTGEQKATAYLRERIAVEVQRGNSRMVCANPPLNFALEELFMM